MSIRNKINQDKMFVSNAIVKVPRSVFYRNQKHSTTFNAGKLVPVYCDTIVPGDSMDIDFNAVIRATSPFIKAPMDDLRADYYAFFVPARICWKDFPKMIANYSEDPAQWTTDIDYVVPQVNLSTAHEENQAIDTVADHMGIPPTAVKSTLENGMTITRLPFLAYARIWNEWFRDENLQNAIYAPDDLGSGDVSNLGFKDEVFTTSASVGGQLAPMNKIKDYFSSCLPAPQAGAAPTISIGGRAPLTDLSISGTSLPLVNPTHNGVLPVRYYNQDGGQEWYLRETFANGVTGTFYRHGTQYPWDASAQSGSDVSFAHMESQTPNFVIASSDLVGTYKVGADLESTYADMSSIKFSGFADLSQATGINVNDLRYLVQIQQMKETDARYGRRYKEYLMGHWGVISADARLQLPEFLGHVGFDLNINQTVQTSGTEIDESKNGVVYKTPQSNISSYSLTSSNNGKICNKSFTEHGYLIILGGVRIKHRTYAQGVNRMWFRKSRFDYYDPCLANIGEQPVSEAEIYADPNNNNLGNVFGYQEAWANYRYLPNICSGYQRPQISETLAYWNFADNYTTTPTLSSSWVEEDISSIDRCLAITSEIVPQFTADFYIRNKATRPMPTHSIPGLVDHSGKTII